MEHIPHPSQEQPIVEVQQMPRSVIDEIPAELLRDLLETLTPEERQAFEAWRDYEGPRRSSGGAAETLGISKRVLAERIDAALDNLAKAYRAEKSHDNNMAPGAGI